MGSSPSAAIRRKYEPNRPYGDSSPSTKGGVVVNRPYGDSSPSTKGLGPGGDRSPSQKLKLKNGEANNIVMSPRRQVAGLTASPVHKRKDLHSSIDSDGDRSSIRRSVRSICLETPRGLPSSSNDRCHGRPCHEFAHFEGVHKVMTDAENKSDYLRFARSILTNSSLAFFHNTFDASAHVRAIKSLAETFGRSMTVDLSAYEGLSKLSPDERMHKQDLMNLLFKTEEQRQLLYCVLAMGTMGMYLNLGPASSETVEERNIVSPKCFGSEAEEDNENNFGPATAETKEGAEGEEEGEKSENNNDKSSDRSVSESRTDTVDCADSNSSPSKTPKTTPKPKGKSIEAKASGTVVKPTAVLPAIDGEEPSISELFLESIGTNYEIHQKISHKSWLRTVMAACEDLPIAISLASASRSRSGFPLAYVNKKFERTTGFSRSEVRGQNCRFLQGNSTNKQSIREMSRALRDAKPVQVDLINYARNGTKWRNLLSMKPIFDQSGQYRYVLAVQFDTTEKSTSLSKLILAKEFMQFFPNVIIEY